MARTTLTVLAPGDAGAEVPLVAGTADGHQFPNDGRVLLYVVNGAAATRDLTIVTGRTYGGKAIADQTVTVQITGTNGGRHVIGPFPVAVYNQEASPSLVYLNFPAGNEGDLSVAAIRI